MPATRERESLTGVWAADAGFIKPPLQVTRAPQYHAPRLRPLNLFDTPRSSSPCNGQNKLALLMSSRDTPPSTHLPPAWSYAPSPTQAGPSTRLEAVYHTASVQSQAQSSSQHQLNDNHTVESPRRFPSSDPHTTATGLTLSRSQGNRQHLPGISYIDRLLPNNYFVNNRRPSSQALDTIPSAQPPVEPSRSADDASSLSYDRRYPAPFYQSPTQLDKDGHPRSEPLYPVPGAR